MGVNEWQWIANGLFGLVTFLGGIVYSDIRKGMKAQDEELSKLAEKVQNIEVLVAGNYVHKNDLEKVTDALFRKLDQICEKIDRKADR